MNGPVRDVAFQDLLAEPVRNGVYKSREFHGHGTKVVNMKELFAYERIEDQPILRVQMTDSELAKFQLAPGDLLFARRSFVLEGAGKCSIIGTLGEPTVFESSMIRARIDRAVANPSYLYHLFRSDLGRSLMATIASRTAVSGITGSNLSRLRLPVLPVSMQEATASVLDAFDELVENNRRRIELLEQIAEGIYREWFVRFRYPGHQDVPLVDSPLGPIPETWKVRQVAAIAGTARNAVTGGPFGSKLGRKDYIDAGVPVLRGGNLRVGGGFDETDLVFVSEEKAAELRASLATPGDIIVTQRGTLGQVGLIPLRSRFHRYLLSQSQMKITVDGTQATAEFIYAQFRMSETTGRFIAQAMSSGVPHVNLGLLREFELLVPPLALQAAFTEALAPGSAEVLNLSEQRRVLESIRDLLLPKLVTGQIDVSQLDLDALVDSVA